MNPLDPDTRFPGDITVVIATTLSPDRLVSLEKAVRSVEVQREEYAGDIGILMVVNGSRFDPDALVAWKKRPGVRVEYLERGFLPGALIYARSRIETPYFSFLDDDDEYIPGTLASRAAVLEAEPDVDVSVANSIHVRESGESIAVTHHEMHERDLVLGLADHNWLSSAAGLFREATVGPEFWTEDDAYFEWTAVAFRLGLHRKVRLLREPGCRINVEGESLSRSSGYVKAAAGMMERLIHEHSSVMNPDQIRVWGHKLGGSLHLASEIARSEGMWMESWGYHLKSLKTPGGLRFLAYTRKLLIPTSGAPVAHG